MDRIIVVLCVCLLSLSIMFSKFAHVVAWISTSFLFTDAYYSSAWLHHILFIHSSIDGQLDCFCFLTIRIMLLWASVEFQCGHMLSFLLGIYLRVKLLDHMVTLWFNFLRNCQTIFSLVILQALFTDCLASMCACGLCHWWLRGKESACNAGDMGLIPESGRSLGEGNGNPLQYSCLGNPMDREAWQAIVHGVTKCRTRLDHHHVCLYSIQFSQNSLRLLQSSSLYRWLDGEF